MTNQTGSRHDTAMAGVEAQLSQLIDQNPNDPKILQAVEKLLDATDGSAGAMRLLFQLYLHPALCEAGRGILTAIIVKMIRRDAGLFDPRPLGLDQNTPAFKMIYRGLKHHLDHAVDEIDLLARLQNGEMDERVSPRFIVAIPKSGSSLLGLCVGGMIALTRGVSLEDDPFVFRGYPAWWNLGTTHDWDLRPEIGMDPLFKRFPGGVYKGHISPSEKNFAVLGLYRASRYLVVVREPRDQIVAAYCDSIRAQNRAEGNGGCSGRRGRGEVLLSDADVRADLVRYMQSGKLLENLTFVGKWLAMRDPERSMVVTYERLMAEPERLLGEVAQHFELDVSRAQIHEVYQRASGITDRIGGQDRSGHDKAIYPLGWTGRVGVWKDYFSAKAGEVFARGLRGFCDLCPWGGEIKELYPEVEQGARAALRVSGNQKGTEALRSVG